MSSAAKLSQANNADRTKKQGRPPNVFNMPAAAFQGWYRHQKWEGVEGLDNLLADGGALGMAGEGSPFWVELRMVARNTNYYYVRLLSRDGEVDFAWPAPMSKNQLGHLMEHWNLFNVRWTESFRTITQGFPFDDWKVAPVMAFPSPTVMWFSVLEQTPLELKLTLMQRAGWSTYFSRSFPNRMLVGVHGTKLNDIEPIIVAANKSGVQLVPGEPVPYKKEVYDGMLAASAAYTKRKLLTAEEKFVHPFIPHADILGIDRKLMAELTL